jgi:hypothetical protein
MTTKHLPRWLVAGLSAVLLVLSAGTPAYADSDGWLSPSCATGEITNYLAERDANGDVTIRLDGWSARCGPQMGHPNDVYRFGLGLYTDDGAWLGALTDYQGLSPTPFTYVVDYTAAAEELGDPPVALCLAYAPTSRMSCVSVTTLSTQHPPSLQPLATDDPSVQFMIDVPCGNCLIGPARSRNLQ